MSPAMHSHGHDVERRRVTPVPPNAARPGCPPGGPASGRGSRRAGNESRVHAGRADLLLGRPCGAVGFTECLHYVEVGGVTRVGQGEGHRSAEQIDRLDRERLDRAQLTKAAKSNGGVN